MNILVICQYGVMALKLLLLFVKLSCAIEFTNYDNGWKPLPADIALFHTISERRNFIEPTLNSDDVKVEQPQLIHSRKMVTSYINSKKQETKNINRNNDKEGINLYPNANNDFRKAKQLFVNKNVEQPIEKETVKMEIKYEVTETPDIPNQINTEEKNTYIYEVPRIQLISPQDNAEKSLTTKFLEILARNNLDSKKDELNYALSRSRKIHNRNLLVTLPVQIPPRFDTHIRTDAILAMMLSNYGLYLPGMFGHTDRYKKMYGYQQSNHIHNNKPLGLYKVLPDTDSSF